MVVGKVASSGQCVASKNSAKQGDAALASLNVAGEAKLGAKFTGTAKVDGTIVAEATFTAMIAA